MGTKYSTQSASGYNSSPPSDDGTAVSTNEVKWSFIKDKLGDPVKDLADSINNELVAHFDESVTDKSTNFTTTTAEHKKTVNATAAITVSLGDASTMAAGYLVFVKNSHTATITVDLATGTDTLDGTVDGSVELAPNEAVLVITNSGASGYFILAKSVGALIAESSDHNYTPAAGYGEVWVKDDAPNVLKFTDDAGADFTPMGAVVMSSIATTSGTTHDFTSIPSWATEITLGFDAVQHDGTSNMRIQIGDSGGFETSGYDATTGIITGAGGAAQSTDTQGFPLRIQAVNEQVSGRLVLTLMDASTNTWAASAQLNRDSTTEYIFMAGAKSLSATLTQVRLTSWSSDTFNGGKVGLRYS